MLGREISETLETARDMLANSARVAAFSGAGLSAESGLATFRDPEAEALWARFDPLELASIAGFEANPQRVIDWYDWRRGICATVLPNAAHRALAAQQRMVQITQNVDHLLELAGVSEERVYHLHGSLLDDRCHSPDCGHRERVELDVARGLRECPCCSAWMRPAVVWFGESLPLATWLAAERLCGQLDCLLVIGTSATVYPAAGLIALARSQGARILVVDPNPGAASDRADLHLAAPAAEVLPRLLAGLELASAP